MADFHPPKGCHMDSCWMTLVKMPHRKLQANEQISFWLLARSFQFWPHISHHASLPLIHQTRRTLTDGFSATQKVAKDGNGDGHQSLSRPETSSVSSFKIIHAQSYFQASTQSHLCITSCINNHLSLGHFHSSQWSQGSQPLQGPDSFVSRWSKYLQIYIWVMFDWVQLEVFSCCWDQFWKLCKILTQILMKVWKWYFSYYEFGSQEQSKEQSFSSKRT